MKPDLLKGPIMKLDMYQVVAAYERLQDLIHEKTDAIGDVARHYVVTDGSCMYVYYVTFKDIEDNFDSEDQYNQIEMDFTFYHCGKA